MPGLNAYTTMLKNEHLRGSIVLALSTQRSFPPPKTFLFTLTLSSLVPG